MIWRRLFIFGRLQEVWFLICLAVFCLHHKLFALLRYFSLAHEVINNFAFAVVMPYRVDESFFFAFSIVFECLRMHEDSSYFFLICWIQSFHHKERISLFIFIFPLHLCSFYLIENSEDFALLNLSIRVKRVIWLFLMLHLLLWILIFNSIVLGHTFRTKCR